MGPLVYLTYFAIIILIGIFCSIISDKLKIPNVLLLVVVGILLNNIHYQGHPLIEFPVMFITTIAILALVMIVFDSCSRLKFKEFNDFSFKALELSIVFLLVNMVLLTAATYYLFPSESIYLILIFAALMSGTDPSTVMIMVKNSKHRVIELLKIESIINTPLIVLIPFILLDFKKSVQNQIVFSKIVEQITPFLQQIITGIGAGVLVGIIIFKFMRKKYSKTFSPLVTIAAALLSYVLAENIGGNGVLAVTALGLMFGRVYVREKQQLQEFSYLFTVLLEVLVFVLVGLLIKIPLNWGFFVSSIILYVIFLIIRFISLNISFPGKGVFRLKEKIFMTLNTPKGIAVAVVAAIFVTLDIPGMAPILNLTLAFLVYSIIVATITLKFSKFFLKTEVIK